MKPTFEVYGMLLDTCSVDRFVRRSKTCLIDNQRTLQPTVHILVRSDR